MGHIGVVRMLPMPHACGADGLLSDCVWLMLLARGVWMHVVSLCLALTHVL